VIRDENEMIVDELLYQFGKDWELSCVLPDIVSDLENDWEYGMKLSFGRVLLIPFLTPC
jgi:hypothetical protein